MWVPPVQLCPCFHPMYCTITTLPCHVAHSTAQNGCNDNICSIWEYTLHGFTTYVTEVFVKVTLSFLLCVHSKKDIVPLTKTLKFVMWVADVCKLYSHNTTNDIITAVLGCTVHGHMTRKCCDCAVHESEVWTWLHRCNSHDKGLC